ncbi:glycoside hydrolase family 78 protein [Bifidobacterium amazonense]|uniref:alpha-L-rhamnosidase n=1 Tax=Bifidobacterium amazonense TaxID=2809027 RepID=A0ABS9VXN0_9BIFI|nr:alpha-L-rhamnosidase [Bifidobacterium amazonense]MCH9276575.1 glycoside hydrolase family 78 protein [Bifidobacterium amazonense]
MMATKTSSIEVVVGTSAATSGRSGDSGEVGVVPGLGTNGGRIAGSRTGIVADMIAGPDDEIVNDTGMRRPPVIARSLELDAAPARALLHVSAHGLVEADVNGRKAGDDVLTPGWTVYGTRLPVWTYDVTGLLHAGRNMLLFRLADGWYRGRIGFGDGQEDCYGSRLGLIAQLEITDARGTTTVVASNADDGLWRAAYGPIVSSGLYEGETVDARVALPAWDDAEAAVAGAVGSSGTPDGVAGSGADADATGADGIGVGSATVDPATDQAVNRWQPVERLDFDRSTLYPADESTAVRCVGEREPVAISRLADGRWLVDFGQNCTQRVVLRIPDVPAGHEIDIQHVEVLNPDGTPATRPLRRAVQHDRYIASGHECDGGKATRWEPSFTMHGFRYAVIGGWPEGLDLTAADLHTRVYSSARTRLGWFSCSSDRVNRLHENVRWSMLSNFVSIPTDCPQRDERFGWTGDIAVFAPTAAYLYDVTGFLDSWLDDVAIETDQWGTVPYYVPYPYPGWGKPDAVALWGDAATMVPWALYMATGDSGLLRRHLPLATRWMDQVAGLLADDGVWDREPDVWCGQLGDWLDPTAPPDDAARAMTEKPLVATAFAAHSADLVARMLRVVDGTAGVAAGDDAGVSLPNGSIAGMPAAHDAAYYGRLAAHIRAGFRARFVRADGRMTSDTQCAYALAIALNLLDDAANDAEAGETGIGRTSDACTAEGARLRAIAGERLAELVRERGFVVGTGFAGTPYVMDALCATGHADEAFSLFLSDKCPSWLYQVRMGATTTWERWDSMLPDGNVNPGDMTSFNHYALGSVASWMHDAIGGLRVSGAGWREVTVAPQIKAALAHGLTSGSAAHETPFGRVEVLWKAGSGAAAGEGVNSAGCTIDVTVPDGVKAVLAVSGVVDASGTAVPVGTSLAAGTYRFHLL